MDILLALLGQSVCLRKYLFLFVQRFHNTYCFTAALQNMHVYYNTKLMLVS